MKKVIAIRETGQRILTTRQTAEKNNWWITHNLVVYLLPETVIDCTVSLEPEVDNIMKGPGKRFYRILKSEKVLICFTCKKNGGFRINFKFYCKTHYKYEVVTTPIRKASHELSRNSACSCGSGKKFKNCCLLTQEDHPARHYFNSRYMFGTGAPKSLTL